MSTATMPPIEDTVISTASVTIALEPGVEQTFTRARVEVMPPKPGRGDKAAVMILIWANPEDLLLWGTP